MGVALCAFTAGIVLVINVIITISVTAKYGVRGTIVTIQAGRCSKTKAVSLWLHLIINILSTLLLGASNYCMQCLSSPTRAEIDSAHSRHIWLDIGVPSVRNLRGVSWKKIILWWLFAISSFPLHLLYNSAIFSSTGANEYDLYIGSENVLTEVGLNWAPPCNNSVLSNDTLQYLQNAAKWANLTYDECRKAYSPAYVSNNNNVLAVVSFLDESSPILTSSHQVYLDESAYQGNWFGTKSIGSDSLESVWFDSNWLPNNCSGNNLPAGIPNTTITTAAGCAFPNSTYDGCFYIQYCLSQETDVAECQLQFNFLITIIVISCNITKLACMVTLLLGQEAKPLVTLGDAVESFLATPDATTEQMCLANKTKFYTKKHWSATRNPYEPKQPLWYASASEDRWATCIFSYVGLFLFYNVRASERSQSCIEGVYYTRIVNPDYISSTSKSIRRLS